MQNENLRAEADRRRLAFFQTASALSTHATPSKIVDELVGAIDPNFTMLNRLKTETQHNPFALLAAIGGLWLLSRQIMTTRNTNPKVPALTRPYKSRLASSKGNGKTSREELASDDVNPLNERT